jgi:hypothetical protein
MPAEAMLESVRIVPVSPHQLDELTLSKQRRITFDTRRIIRTVQDTNPGSKLLGKRSQLGKRGVLRALTTLMNDAISRRKPIDMIQIKLRI